MFDIPDAKRVCRCDLYTPSQSPTPSNPDPELEDIFRARLTSLYGSPSFVPPACESIVNHEPRDINGSVGVSEEQGEQEFEFRLFSISGAGTQANDEDLIAQRITLVDDEQQIGDGGFVVRERDRTYYFAEKALGHRQLGFETIALSGEEVLSRAKNRAWGLEVPWRVRVLKEFGKKGSGVVVRQSVDSGAGDGDAKRKRPGKQRRIILRERRKSREMLLEQRKAENEEREDAEREKRTRRNREKKVKRKIKEKAKKADERKDDPNNGSIKLRKIMVEGPDEDMID